MGDRENAAAALAHMPRWVAVHENTLAKIEAALAAAMSEGWEFDHVWDEIEEAKDERDIAIGRGDQLDDEIRALSEQIPDCEMGHQMKPGPKGPVHYWPIDLGEHYDATEEIEG